MHANYDISPNCFVGNWTSFATVYINGTAPYYIEVSLLHSSKFHHVRKFHAWLSYRFWSENRRMSSSFMHIVFCIRLVLVSRENIYEMSMAYQTSSLFAPSNFYNAGKLQRKSTRLNMQLRDNRTIRQSSFHADILYSLPNFTSVQNTIAFIKILQIYFYTFQS